MNAVPARTYPVDEILSLLARRRWLILVPFALGVAAAPLLARYAPERYRSDALILVIPQRVPDSYVKPTVSESVEQRLPAITDQILSRSRLERIIQDMDLYKTERSRDVMENVVETMRKDVVTTAVGKEVNSFRVSYISRNAETARKVTERLAALYIEQNTKDRESQAVSTSQFLATQLEEAKRRLIEQEKKLEEYRRGHAGQLPSQLPGNLQAIQNANLQLQSLNESTNRAQERRLLIERQIADTQAVPLPPAPLPPPMTTSEVPASASTAQQLDLARARLASLLQRYTPDHPEVVSLQRTIAELAARLESETPMSATQAAAEKPITPAEAAQRKRILDLQAELAVLDHQLAANRAEEEGLKKTIASYQSKVDVVPTRESELVELTRDYSTLQTAYVNLLTKREDSVIAANLEQRQIGEQFKLLDVASLPERPSNQLQRLAVMASGAAAGLALGLLIVGLLEYRDPSFRREEEVLAALSLPVLALIPIMTSERERRVATRRRWAVDAGGSALLLAAAAILVFWRLRF
jgi:polysaccharide chain length determinant protein (PEP-CTERM system associated)